jgi:tRNA U34 5-methylaminomethyl-2-thiouridine-forming methyltransferase MnmC
MNTTTDTLIPTGDGSLTLHSAEFNENMHSLSGAYEEALLKHVIPSGVLKLKSDRIAVLDVGFGIGYNTLALLAGLADINYAGMISVVSFEAERSFLPFMETVTFNDARDDVYGFIKKAYRDAYADEGNASIRILFSDARVSIRALADAAFDAVFFDPYSPSRNPELWSVEFFREVFRIMSARGVLTTYSSAPQVRSALLEAGFIIGRGPSVGGKREGTLAAKSDNIEPLPRNEIAALGLNARAVPYRDRTLGSGRSEILQRRLVEIKLARGTRD